MAYVFQPKYSKKEGGTDQSRRWWVGLRDHRRIVRTFPGYTDKRLTEEMGKKLQRLVEALGANEEPPKEVRAFIANAPPAVKERLVKFHMIEPEKLAAELRAYIEGREPNDLLFHGDTADGSMTKQTAKMLKKDLNVAEIPYVDDGKFHDFHAFRHTTNQWLQDLGVPPRIIQWILRHKVMKMQDIYTRENVELMAREIRKASAYGRQKAEPEKGADSCAA